MSSHAGNMGKKTHVESPNKETNIVSNSKTKKSMQERYCEYIVQTKIWNSCFLRMMFKVIDSTLS